MIKAISLLSGGLDSILATRLMLDEGIDIEAINFDTGFYGYRKVVSPDGRKAADELGIKLKIFDISRDCLEIVKNPKHGYGSNMNPCIDCRIFMFKKAAEYMKERDAAFIITGEVLGERPMSQRRDAMMLIERKGGLKGLILRPLSAKLLEPTIPEKEGWVSRERLLDIKGRSRKLQIRLAVDFNIKDYPTPAGGCLLTDPGFAGRMRDLIKYKLDVTPNDVQLLGLGRHFRIAPETKLVVGRNKEENDKLSHLAGEGDICFYPIGTNGPVGIGRGAFDNVTRETASGVVARYCDGGAGERIKIAHRKIPDDKKSIITALPAEQSYLDTLRI